MIGVELPVGWTVKRLKYVATYNDEVLPEETQGETEIDYVEISGVSLSKGIKKMERTTFEKAPSRARRRARDGDIIVSTVRTYLKAIAKVERAPSELIVSTGFCVVRPVVGVDHGYLGWVLKSELFVSEMVARSVGVSYPAINPRELAAIDVPLPSLNAQQKIARFLDEKTTQIDALIDKKQELIRQLSDMRQALIVRAVTVGLDSEVAMKSSGVDWPSTIPVGWEVRRIKDLGKLVGGSGFPHDMQGHYDLELPFFKVADLGEVALTESMSEADNTVDRDMAKALGATIIRPGDVAFAKVGAALLLNRFRSIRVPACIDNNMMAFRPSSKIEPEFALFALSRIDFTRIVNPGAIPSVGASQVGEIQVMLPPIDEQQRIVEALRKDLEKLEKLERAIGKTIAELEKYRSSLVIAAVTGKLGVNS